MWPNPQFPADLVAFTEGILNGKLQFCRVIVLEYVFSLIKFTKVRLILLGATKLQREIIFVCTTKIEENTANILNCYCSN